MKKIAQKMEFKPFCVLVAIILICGVISGGDFFKITIVDGHFYGRLIDILRNGSRYAILAAGMTMALGTGGTDISVGSVMAISGAIACSVVDERILPGLSGNVFSAVLIALLAGAICGAWNGFMIAKLKVQPMVATMILLTAGRGIAQLIADGKIVTITSESYYSISGGYILGLPAPMFIAAGVVALFLILTKRTAFGMQVESIGVNPDSSRLAGIRVEKNLWIIYILCGLTAALAGLIESAGIKGADCNNCGLMIEMDGILSVAIGGTSLSGGRFSIVSSVIGALIVQTISTTIYAFGVAPELTRVAKAVIVIIVCLIQSQSFMDRMKGLFACNKKKEAQA
ncbi:MAG: ABC transporter permease [Lachnospiraceae bacterium]|nr:ABC transporter permease [Lachnospiraceae bacterium]